MFETASSRGDYYKLVAQKVFNVRKELEARRKYEKGEFCIGCMYD